MRKLFKHFLLVVLLGHVFIASAHAEVRGFASDVGKTGLTELGNGLFALAVGIALAGLFIGIGIAIGKRRSGT